MILDSYSELMLKADILINTRSARIEHVDKNTQSGIWNDDV